MCLVDHITVCVQEELLEELSQWHTDARSFAESTYEAVEKTKSQLQDAVQFSERLLHYGSAQILPLRQIALRRMLSMSSALPYMMRAVTCQNSIEFETDENKFCAVVQAGFGHIANVADGSGTTCCGKIDDSVSVGDEMCSKRDVSDGSLIILSQVSVCFCCSVITDPPTRSV